MKDFQTLLYELKSKPHLILPHYATALGNKLEKYLAGDMPLPCFEEDANDNQEIPENNDGIEVIDICGVICKRLGLPEEVTNFFGMCDLDHVDEDIREAMADANINAVILNVNSPGGFLSGVQTTANLISELSKLKETVVYSDVLNCSAAYWLSSKANSIITTADCEVGSIGVYTELIEYSKQLAEEGITATLIKAGKYKGIGCSTQPLTDEQKAYIQDDVNKTWNTFKEAVNEKRTIADDDMQGQCFTGEDLINKGFVDGFAGNINEVRSTLLAKE